LLTYDIVRLTLQLVKPVSLTFIAGQYIQLRSQPYDNHEAVLRNYSIASPSSAGSSFDLMIRRVPGGICTGWIFDKLSVGDTLSFTAPFGRFKLSASNAPVLFVAGGSGMGPMYAILRDMLEKNITRKAFYFFGAVTQKDLFLTEELQKLTNVLPDFTFIPAVSNEPADSSWQGERGLITDVLARHFPDCSAFEGYLCGSPGMISACRKVLIANNMPAEHIFYDSFA
jgi:Na+-transporting NADH:ubiquinone oxidoreductase subunit F